MKQHGKDCSSFLACYSIANLQRFVRTSFGTLAHVRCFVYAPIRQQPIDTMLTNLHTPTFTAEATSVASVLPCRQGFDTKLRPGYVLVLAGSHAR